MKTINGYMVWDKGERSKLTPNFSTSEFECQCKYSTCIEQRVSIRLLTRLQTARDEMNHPLTITSGFRCARHQKDLNNDPGLETVAVSTHESGDAADVKPGPQTSGAMGRALYILSKQFNAIGIGKTFYHVDLRGLDDGKKRSWRYRY